METRRYTALTFIAVSFAALCGVNRGFADQGSVTSTRLSQEQLTVVESNLIVALKSDSPGLQASAAQVIRDIKARVPEYDFARSIIPLMGILKDNDKDPGVRGIAALTLHEIGSDRGDFAIKQESRFCSQPQLRRLCTWLTYARVNGDLAAMTASNAGSSKLIGAGK